MTAKIKTSLIDEAERLAIEGHTFSYIKSVLGTSNKMAKYLKERGIRFRSTNQAANGRFLDLPELDVVAAYASGESEPSLSLRYNVSRAVITRILREHNIPRRSGSEANYIRMSRMSLDEKRELVKNANEAMRNSDPTRRLKLTAQRVEEGIVVRNIGRGETEVASELRKRGYDVTLQKAFDIYNVDIVFGTVAVEIKFGAHSRFANNASGFKDAKRIPKIVEAGYKYILCVFTNSTGLVEGLQDVISFMEIINRKPAVPSQYWMIRCGLQYSPVRKRKLINEPVIPPPPELVTSIRKIDIR
jgi:hypothetical protein